jgi:tRNA pseudouridine55 synthase
VTRVLPQFIGEIEQTPSVYSAIKINGQEAYKLARKGQAVEMPKRMVTINSIEVVGYDYPKLTIRADVSSGTYIRSLAEDIGSALKTGAYLSALRRTRVGEYVVGQAVPLNSVPDKPDLLQVDKAE